MRVHPGARTPRRMCADTHPGTHVVPHCKTPTPLRLTFQKIYLKIVLKFGATPKRTTKRISHAFTVKENAKADLTLWKIRSKIVLKSEAIRSNSKPNLEFSMYIAATIVPATETESKKIEVDFAGVGILSSTFFKYSEELSEFENCKRAANFTMRWFFGQDMEIRKTWNREEATKGMKKGHAFALSNNVKGKTNLI